MLLTKTVKIPIYANNVTYFKDLGYKIPLKKSSNIYENSLYERYNDPSFKGMSYDFGKLITVNVEHLNKGSSAIIECECDNCKKIEYIKYNVYARRDYKDYCPTCAQKLFRSGKNSCSWKADKTDEEREKGRATSENSQFVKTVYNRDNYTCICCGDKNSTLNAHHLDGWDWCVEKRYDPKNGVTLCKKCHNNFHNKYGRGGNTKEQFEEWIGRVIENPYFELVINKERAIYCYEEDKIYYGGVKEYCLNHGYDYSKSNSRIYNVCNVYKNIDKSSLSYTFKSSHLFWYDEYINTDPKIVKYILSKGGNNYNKGSRKETICLVTGILYKSSFSVSEELDANLWSVRSICTGIRKSKLKESENNLNIPLTFMYKENYDKLSSKEKLNIILKYKESLYDDSFLFKEYIKLTTEMVEEPESTVEITEETVNTEE